MIRLASKATLLSAVALVTAGAALAGVPNSTNSNINFAGGGPGILYVGGKAGSVVDVRSEKQVLVRDAALNPVNNSVVTINFTGCYSGVADIRIGDATAQTFNTTVNCGAHTISATTNASGIAVFRVVGAGKVVAASDPGVGEGCASITADGVPLGAYSVATPDYNGGGTVNGSDLLFFNFGLFTAPTPTGGYRSRYNYSNSGGAGNVNGSDALAFNGFLAGLGSTAVGVTYCP
jgi:hypothetical protein